MNTLNNAVNAILSENENFKFVAVKFGTSEAVYHYKTLSAVKIGDYVVVPVNANHQLKVAEVTEVLDFFEVEEAAYKYKWVVTVFDTTDYDKAVETEKAVAQALRKEQQKHMRKQALEALKEGMGEESLDNMRKLVRL